MLHLSDSLGSKGWKFQLHHFHQRECLLEGSWVTEGESQGAGAETPVDKDSSLALIFRLLLVRQFQSHGPESSILHLEGNLAIKAFLQSSYFTDFCPQK